MSALGTRTNRVVPLVWLKRVGFRQASNEWRVTFFSRAPRILTHGFGATAGVAANDITLPMLRATTGRCPSRKSRANATKRLAERTPGVPWFSRVLGACTRLAEVGL